MLLSTRIKLALALWFAAEAVVFVLVAEAIGYPEALLVSFLTSLFGWTLMKRAGAATMVKLRALLDGRVAGRDAPRFLDDGLATMGALALLMPGFLSDVVGLALAVPRARDRLAQWMGAGRLAGVGATRPGAPRGPSTIDLEPGEWQRDEARRPVPKV